MLGINPAGTDENSRTANQYLSQSVRGSTLESTTVPASLRLRNGWQMAPANTLHPNADLQAYHPGQDMFLVVLAESTTSVPPGNLEEQAARYLDLMKRGFDRVLSNEQRTQVERINNFPAVQYELKGDVLTQAVAYLHTTIQMDERYYQVVVWIPRAHVCGQCRRYASRRAGVWPRPTLRTSRSVA